MLWRILEKIYCPPKFMKMKDFQNGMSTEGGGVGLISNEFDY